jgi:hypothetical protein
VKQHDHIPYKTATRAYIYELLKKNLHLALKLHGQFKRKYVQHTSYISMDPSSDNRSLQVNGVDKRWFHVSNERKHLLGSEVSNNRF